MRKIIYLILFCVGLLSACEADEPKTNGYQGSPRDTIFVKEAITYKVIATYVNGDVDTLYIKESRSSGTIPHVDASNGVTYIDLEPMYNNNQYIYHVRRVDILGHD